MRKDYDVLGISENADEKTIKRAYFQLIRKHSPEKDPERFQEIRAAYERLTEEKNQPENSFTLEFPADDKFAKSMFDQIQQLMREENYERAIRTAEEGMRYYQEVECFLYMYARCSILNGNPGKAIKAYEKLVKRYPDKIYYISELAKAYHIRGFWRKAYPMFQKAFEEGWREADFLIEYSLCCYENGWYEDAVQILESFINSVPVKETGNRIPELLEAYARLFVIYISEPFPPAKIVDSCIALLDQISRKPEDYEEQLQRLYLAALAASIKEESEEIKLLLNKLAELLPDDMDGEEDDDMEEAFELLEDDRFSQLMKITVEAFMLLDETDFPGDSFDKYCSFMQMDALLCQLEAWPEQKKELELMSSEYPVLYEYGKEIWDMLRESRDKRSFLKDEILADYVRAERVYKCGHYYELYPDKCRNMDRVQWDSLESGTFVRQGKKIGRNDPCPCGSGKKYKNCCGKRM